MIPQLARRRRKASGSGPALTLTEQVVAFFAGVEEGGVWDFTDAANLATATDGTGAVSNGSVIAYCADLSGNGNHLLQSTAGRQPLWNSAGYGDFSSDVLTADWTATAQPITRVSRVYLGTWAAADYVFGGANASANRAVLLQNGSSPNVAMFAGALSANISVSLNEHHTLTEVYNGASSSLRVDGVNNARNAGTNTIRGISVGGNVTVGSDVNSMRALRVLMIDRALTAGELAIAESWVAEVL